MLIIPYVCAEFRDRSGNRIFRITADMLRNLQKVPDAIEQDLLFDLLVADGSIKVPETAAQRKLLEQEPMLGMNADGRSAARETVPENAVKAEKPVKGTKTKAEGKPAETEQK